MPKLKPWYQEVTPREDLRENRPMDASEFAVHLDHIREGRGTVSKDYTDPARFFERTYLTGSLLDLASQVVRRLSGVVVETSAVFNMATQFGGGKTHALATLYHLARQGEKAKSLKGVDRILGRAEIKHVPSADVAVFVGNEFDVIAGRSGKGEPHRKTPWGEIAWQLGGKEGFHAVAKHDESGVAPAGEALRAMLPDGPTLILMDELLNYVSRGRKAGLRDQFYNFLQNLTEEARARKNLVLCVSIPASELEMNPDDQRDHEALKKLLDRVGKAIMMSAGTEISEIIRRRLFEWGGLSAAGKATAKEYADWAIANAQSLPGVDRDTVLQQFEAAYPFHPAVLSVFERKWQSLQKFQRTRGVLRLLALWVANAYREQHRQATGAPIISLGSAPLGDQTFRSAMFEQLGSNELEIPVTTDIAGKADSHAMRLDREATEEIKKASLHRSVATTIFLESNGGMSRGKAEAALPEIRFGVGGPDVNFANVDPVLEGLNGTCFYLTSDRNRYRFGLSPNLNQILVTRRASVQDKEIDKRVREETEKVFGAGPKEFERRFFPERSNDVPSRPVLTLVVMGMDHAAGDTGTLSLMESIVRDCGASGRTYKSALIFAAPQEPARFRDAARTFLAWEAIDDDEETVSRLEEAQRKTLIKNLKLAEGELVSALWRAYRQLFVLGIDNKLRLIDMGQLNPSMAASLPDLILNHLSQSDEITRSVGAAKLVKAWPPALSEWPTKAVRDAFFSSPALPRLLNPDSLRRTIADAVVAGQLGYATKDSKGRVKLERFAKPMSETDVEISDETYIIRGDDARKLLEPPRLAQINLSPTGFALKPGDERWFVCTGVDQYGQGIALGQVLWDAQGGSIDHTGKFIAGAKEGQFRVVAKVAALEAIATGTVTKDRISSVPVPGKRMMRWSGEIPARVWSNFYLKVISKLVASKDLKLTVTLEVSTEPEQAAAKGEEAKASLRELGLNPDLRLD